MFVLFSWLMQHSFFRFLINDIKKEILTVALSHNHAFLTLNYEGFIMQVLLCSVQMTAAYRVLQITVTEPCCSHHSYLHPSLSGLGLAALSIGLVVRILFTYCMVLFAGFNLKEKLFIAMAWLPKATVQVQIPKIYHQRVAGTWQAYRPVFFLMPQDSQPWHSTDLFIVHCHWCQMTWPNFRGLWLVLNLSVNIWWSVMFWTIYSRSHFLSRQLLDQQHWTWPGVREIRSWRSTAWTCWRWPSWPFW